MPIVPSTTISATNMAANWGPGLTNNAQKWLNKYLAPKAIFNANPTAAQNNYATAVNEAISQNRYATNFGNADVNQAATNATNFGINNYRAAGTNKAYKYTKVSTALAAALTAVRSTVESTPRGPRGSQQNQQRAIAQMTGMAAYRGKIR